MAEEMPLKDRFAMYKARGEALELAAATMKGIEARHMVWTTLSIAGGLIFLWSHPTVRWAIVTGMVLLAIRWLGNLFIAIKYGDPMMKRIDAEFPKPPPMTDD